MAVSRHPWRRRDHSKCDPRRRSVEGDVSAGVKSSSVTRHVMAYSACDGAVVSRTINAAVWARARQARVARRTAECACGELCSMLLR